MERTGRGLRRVPLRRRERPGERLGGDVRLGEEKGVEGEWRV